MNVHELTLQNYTAASGCPSACQPILYLGTAGSYGNEQINVVLGEGWQGLTVKAVFQPSGVPVVVPDGGGVISVPWEATETALDAAKGRIVFEGVTDGRVLISTDIPYAVRSHSDTEGRNSQPPTPSEWEQYVDEVKGDAETASKAAEKASYEADRAQRIADNVAGESGNPTLSVSIGKVTTGEPGTDAEVKNSGNDTDIQLDFTIPRGDTGPAAGFGTPTATAHLVDGPPTVAVTASGPDTAKIFHFDFGIPGGEEQHEEYTGPTEVEPEFREIKLETKGTALNDDITIKPIQMTTIENPAGGNTLII